MLRLDYRLKIVFPFGMLLAGLAFATSSQGADTITVTIAGGQSYSGFVDLKTDDRQLWLRREEGTGMLRRPISWERIESASRDGQPIALGELPALARQIATSRHVRVQPRTMRAVELPPATPPQHVQSLSLQAIVANWDADVEADGLIVEIRLLDDEGRETTANGTLDVELFAPRMRKYHEAPQSRGYSVDLIERWSVPLSQPQFNNGTARVRLPFNAIHPEFDRRVDGLGLVHARLAVPGEGVFEQSLDGISLRSFAPVRDALLDNTGRSFLSTESTGRGKGAYPLPRW